jgi:hypothetical protein
VKRPRRLADAYERYAALIIAQLEAVERGEVDALETLFEQRARLADEIEAIAVAQENLSADEEARQQLERCQAADLRLRARLGAIRDGALSGVRQLAERRLAARTYTGSAVQGSKLDVEL